MNKFRLGITKWFLMLTAGRFRISSSIDEERTRKDAILEWTWPVYDRSYGTVASNSWGLQLVTQQGPLQALTGTKLPGQKDPLLLCRESNSNSASTATYTEGQTWCLGAVESLCLCTANSQSLQLTMASPSLHSYVRPIVARTSDSALSFFTHCLRQECLREQKRP